MLRYADFDIVFQEIPDEVTLAINISGCPNRCEGCHTPELMGDTGEILTGETLSGLVQKYVPAITCVCFMGGDAAPWEVERLAEMIHMRYRLKTAWYSGRENFPANREKFDYVKLGPYVKTLGNLRNKATNQRLYARSLSNQWLDITHRFWK